VLNEFARGSRIDFDNVFWSDCMNDSNSSTMSIPLILSLPYECVLHIFSFLNAKELSLVSLTCRQWHQLGQDPLLWKKLFFRNSKYKFRGFSNQKTTRNWKQIFIKKLKEEKSQQSRNAIDIPVSVHQFSECLRVKKVIRTNEKLFGLHCDPFFSDDVVIGGTFGNKVMLWDIATGVSLKSFEFHSKPVRCLYFDEYLLISGSMDNSIRIVDMDTETCLNTLVGHTGWVLTLKYDLLHLISGSSDRTIKFWDFHSGACLATLQGHTEAVRCLEASNETVISGAVDSTIRVWDLQKQSSSILSGHTQTVTSCQIISSDPQMLWSSSFDGTVSQWDLRS